MGGGGGGGGGIQIFTYHNHYTAAFYTATIIINIVYRGLQVAVHLQMQNREAKTTK